MASLSNGDSNGEETCPGFDPTCPGFDPFKPGSGAQFAQMVQAEQQASGGSGLSRPRLQTRRPAKTKPTKPAPTTAKTSVLPAEARLKSAQAFIRVRPLLPAEIAAGATVLPGLVIDGDCPLRPEEEQSAMARRSVAASATTAATAGVNALNSTSTPIGGFTGVLGQHDDNISVFERAFLPRIPTVLSGGTASLFCYGYTGAGKTHTVFGYEGEPGIYALAADELITLLDDWNDQHPTREPVMLQISCAEIYNEDVFDLLNGRAPCSLRKNSAGQLMVRGGTTKRVLSAAESDELGGVEFVVQTEGQHALVVRTPEDLADVHTLCSTHRAVGSSSTHDQSSRSHAIFRMDVVSDTLLEVQERVEELEAIKPGLDTLYAKKRTHKLRKKIMEIEAQLKEERQRIADMIDRGVEDGRPADQQNRENGTTVNAFDEWGAMERRSPLGGRLILVDLAGNDSDNRTVGAGGHTRVQQRESNGINKSLLALKECLRGLSNRKGSGGGGGGGGRGVRGNKLPFRNSSMTRLLEEVLVPQRGRDSESVMLVNVAPGAQLGKKTINSLRYGQMFASNSARRRGSGNSCGVRGGRGGGESGGVGGRGPGLGVRERLSERLRLSSAPPGQEQAMPNRQRRDMVAAAAARQASMRPNTEPRALAPRTGDYSNYRTQGEFDAWDD
jgi:hypothetical protein